VSVVSHTLTTLIYTLSLHDALPIFSEAETKARAIPGSLIPAQVETICAALKNPEEISQAVDQLTKLHQQFPSDVEISVLSELDRDRKSTRLNSSHQIISYAVFCLKK